VNTAKRRARPEGSSRGRAADRPGRTFDSFFPRRAGHTPHPARGAAASRLSPSASRTPLRARDQGSSLRLVGSGTNYYEQKREQNGARSRFWTLAHSASLCATNAKSGVRGLRGYISGHAPSTHRFMRYGADFGVRPSSANITSHAIVCRMRASTVRQSFASGRAWHFTHRPSRGEPPR
jgi:hypothetical protein